MTGPEPLISADRVNELIGDCLAPSKDEPGVIVVEGIVNTAYLRREKLEEHRDEINDMLDSLPIEFYENTGGGWTFLNACADRNGVQWTGLHRTMEFLFLLGMGLKRVEYMLPREMWRAFPGGVPYVLIKNRPS